MQSALDAAGLAACARSSLRHPDQYTLQEWMTLQVQKYFAADFPDGYLGAAPVALVTNVIISRDAVQPISFGIQVTASSSDPTDFMQVLGVSNVPVSAYTEIAIDGIYKSEYVYVIDNSALMSQTIDQSPRLTVVQNALTNLILYTFSPTLSNGNYGAIVPFANAVNPGAGYSSWLTGAPPPADWSGCMLSRDPHPE